MAEARVRRSRCSAHVCAMSGGCGGAGVCVNARRSRHGLTGGRPPSACAGRRRRSDARARPLLLWPRSRGRL
eukprot:2984141-Prymnesium_polylepis.1